VAGRKEHHHANVGQVLNNVVENINSMAHAVENDIITRGPSMGLGGQLRAMANAQRLEHARMMDAQKRFDALPCEVKLEMAMNRIMDLEEELYGSNKN
jgi:hypothetical protein